MLTVDSGGDEGQENKLKFRRPLQESGRDDGVVWNRMEAMMFPENEKVGLDDLKDPPAEGSAALGGGDTPPAGILEGGPQVAAKAGRRAGPGKGRARRASGVTAARRGGAKRPPAESHGEGRAAAPALLPPSSLRPRRRPGPTRRRPARSEPLTAARCERRPRKGAARGRAAREGAWGSASAPTTPSSRNPGPRVRERRVGGRAAGGGEGAESEPSACTPVPPGRLLRREPEPLGGRGRAEDNEEAAARRAERPGSPAQEPAGNAPATEPRAVRLSRIPCKEPLLVCQTSRGPSSQLPQTPAAGPPMAVGTSP
nr:serine/arginine repetitive matrix protein 3-like [Camelus dromedarius]